MAQILLTNCHMNIIWHLQTIKIQSNYFYIYSIIIREKANTDFIKLDVFNTHTQWKRLTNLKYFTSIYNLYQSWSWYTILRKCYLLSFFILLYEYSSTADDTGYASKIFQPVWNTGFHINIFFLNAWDSIVYGKTMNVISLRIPYNNF